MLYGLDRFSEDIDFSLLEPDKDFTITDYFTALHDELTSFGFNTEINDKNKRTSTNIESPFIKAGTIKNLLCYPEPLQHSPVCF